MTIIHSFTSDQRQMDNSHKDVHNPLFQPHRSKQNA